MPRSTRQRRAFTLIELMVVVTILGVLAAIAIPTFMIFIRRAKASEATSNINSLFKVASSFYSAERSDQGMVGQTSTSCVVGPTSMSPASVSDDKQKFTVTPNFDTLGFTVADYVYYGYGIDSIGDADVITCLNGAPSSSEIYTLYAHGDLDGDGELSTFELAVGSNQDNVLFHSRGFYINLEWE